MLDKTSWTLTEIAQDLRVNRGKILAWVRSGRLRAMNLSMSRRPRYRVMSRDYADFLNRLAVVPATPRPPRKKLPQVEEDFFPNSH